MPTKTPARRAGRKRSTSADTSATRKKTPARRPRSATPEAPAHEPTDGLYGWITHTDLASHNPDATKKWCAKVLGWTFRPSFPVPGGEVHLFAYSAQGGGGIRPTNASEPPGSLPYVHVRDAAEAFALALKEGAQEMVRPTRVTEGVTIAIVRAPGGVAIGFSGP
jgi:predicted enzyme related to lactoylglutathione lyase